MKIDIHAHILPEYWPNLRERYGYGGFIQLHHNEDFTADMRYDDGRFFRRVEENCYSPEAILRDMDANGVDIMTLCTVPVLFNYWAEPEHCLDWSRFLNDHIAGVQNAHPDRFIGLGTVPLQDTERAARELRRCVVELGLPGVQIGSHVGTRNLDDRSLFPLYEEAESVGACLLIHPWDMMGQNDMKKYWLPWLVGMPAETSRAVCSMLFGGVFDAFPKLRVLFVHAGGSFPHTLGRIIHGYNCRPDLVNLNGVANPREYVGKFWLDSITHDPEALRYVTDLFGAHRIAYGTDYPFPLGDLEHGKMIEEMDYDEATKRQLFAASALDFLNMRQRILSMDRYKHLAHSMPEARPL